VEIVNSFIPDSNCVHTYIEIKTQINGITMKLISRKDPIKCYLYFYYLHINWFCKSEQSDTQN
jgi:hypothetical protein